MGSYGLTKPDLAVVIEKKREHLYQVACLRLFEATHKNSIAENVGNHPNAYFTSSRQVYKDSLKNQKVVTQAEAAVVAPEEKEKEKIEAI